MSSIGKSMDNMILYNHFFSAHSVSNDLVTISKETNKEKDQQITNNQKPLDKPPMFKKYPRQNQTRPVVSKPPSFPKLSNKPVVSKPPMFKKYLQQNQTRPVVSKPPSFPKPSNKPVVSKPPSFPKSSNQNSKNKTVKQQKLTHDKKINPSVIVKRNNTKTKHILPSKNKIKLPDSKYKSYDSHNYDIFVSNDGKILAMNNMCFVYRKSVNNYYNPQLSLQIYSTSTPKNYVVHTSRDEIFNIKITSNYNDLHDVLSTLSKYQMVNHPSEIILTHDLLMEERKFSILFHIVEDRLILDFSNNEDKDDWNDVRNVITNDVLLKHNQINLPIYNIHNWDIQLYKEGNILLQLRFEKDNQVYFSGKWCEQIFDQDEVIGKCDVSFRSDYF